MHRIGLLTNQLDQQQTSQSNNQSSSQSITRSASQLTPQSTNQTADQSVDQPANQSTSQSTNQSANQSANQTINQSVNQPASDALIEDADARRLRKKRILEIAKRDQHWRDLQSINQSIIPQSANQSFFQKSPDRWIARSPTLIPLTGCHPFNAEPPLDRLVDLLIVPKEIFYVRNHGAVPNLKWANHSVKITGLIDRLIDYTDDSGKKCVKIENLPSQSINQFDLSMDAISLLPRNAVLTTFACAANRRKELNLINHSNGFNWGPAAVGTAVWTGVRLIDLLKLLKNQSINQKINQNYDQSTNQSFNQTIDQSINHPIYLHVAGADQLHAGRYETCFELSSINHSINQFLLAYEMNGEPLSPDHGFPLRLIAPGMTGCRHVKWVTEIWLSFNQSSNQYHANDSKILPMSVKTSAAASAWWSRTPPLYESNVQSIIMKPQHEEWINGLLSINQSNNTSTNQPINQSINDYTIKGFAYAGGGRPIIRVEVTLDNGETWLQCKLHYLNQSINQSINQTVNQSIKQSVNQLPSYQSKHWTWTHWSCTIKTYQFYRAKSIKCRAYDSAFNTQANQSINQSINQWNFLGLSNNSIYTVKIDCDNPNSIFFKHPVQPGQLPNNGWMIDHSLNQSINQSINRTDKTIGLRQFSMSDIKGNYAWVIIGNGVYDFSSFLIDHPGGVQSIACHSGENVSDLFFGVHSREIWKAKEMFCIGVLEPPPTPRQLVERANQSVNQAIDQSKKKSCNKSCNKSKDQSKDNESVSQSDNQSDSQSIRQSNNQSVTQSINPTEEFALQVYKWVEATLIKRVDVSEDVRLLTFAFDQPNQSVNHLSNQITNQSNNQSTSQSASYSTNQSIIQPIRRVGLPIGQHVLIGASSTDRRFVARPYTPVRPLIDSQDDGTLDILLKVYFPIPRFNHSINQSTQKPKPGGALSMILENMKIGERVKMKGPTGHVLYGSSGEFSYQSINQSINQSATHLSFVCGGTGLTPAYQMIKYILSNHASDHTKLSLLYSAQSINQLLLYEELLELANDHPNQFRLWFSVDRLPESTKQSTNQSSTHSVNREWPFSVGFIDEPMLRAHVFPPSRSSFVFVCGPAPMLEIAVIPNLIHYGYSKEDQILEF